MRYSFTRFIYTLFLYCLLPFALLKLWIRGKNNANYRKRWRERFGHIQFETRHLNTPALWIHTVSVGEFIAAKPLIDKLIASNKFLIIITSTTITGSERITQAYKLTHTDDNNNRLNIYHYYIPYDITSFISRFLNTINPSIAVFMETELWPNTLHALNKKNIHSILINARMSEKSAKGYARFNWLTRPMLSNLSSAAIQSTADATRLFSLGLKQKNAIITGNIKFDISITNTQHSQANAFRTNINALERYTWIAASTHAGEDGIILEAHGKLLQKQPDALLILVPRHPERFNAVTQLSSALFSTIRKTQLNGQTHLDSQVIIGDTMGEMMTLFGASDVAFVGGSLVQNGGHNTLEPAAWSLPILSGPSCYNFSQITQKLLDKKALTICENSDDIVNSLQLFSYKEKRSQTGHNALLIMQENKGALEKIYSMIISHKINNLQLH